MTGGRQGSLRERIEATADPARFALLCALAAGPSTARELADRSGVPVDAVRHRLRRWLAADIVEEWDRDGRSETVPKRFRLKLDSLFVSGSEARTASRARLNEARSREVGLMLREAMAAARDGMFGVLDAHAASRVPMTVDEEGRRRASGLTEAAISSVVSICEGASERIGTKGGVSFSATVALGFFGRPPIRHSVLDGTNLAELAPNGRGPRNVRIPGDRENPLRLEIAYQLLARPHTVAELVAELGVSRDSIRRALVSLEGEGMVAVEARRTTRGTAEQRWTGNPDARYDVGPLGEAGSAERKAYEQRQIRLVAREWLASARSGQLGEAGAAFLWLPSVLDNQALGAVYDELASFREKMLEVREESLERGAWKVEPRFPSSAALVLFRHH